MELKKKLTFFTVQGTTFLRPIILGLRNDYRVKSFVQGQEKEYYQIYNDTDIAWFEWGDDFAVSMISGGKNHIKHILRIHSYELFHPALTKMDWAKVDLTIFVSELVKNMCIQKFGINPKICHVVNNGIDIAKFPFNKKKKTNKKIAYIGYINYKKGIDLLLQAFASIHKYDPSYKFYIAGQHQDERIKLYMDYLVPLLPYDIQFDGWVEDMPQYLTDKDFVISTSFFESFQYSLAEGMSQGCIPLVHNWPGSLDIYPKRFVYNTLDEMVEIVKAYDTVDEKARKEEREIVSNHIKKNFNLDDKLSEIKNLIAGLV